VSSGSRKKNTAVVRRRDLVEGILAAGRESSAATVMLHTAIAERSGLTATDTKTIDTLIRLGPVTAGELAGYTGLATASVTSLIDRLEKKGLVRVRPDSCRVCPSAGKLRRRAIGDDPRFHASFFQPGARTDRRYHCSLLAPCPETSHARAASHSQEQLISKDPCRKTRFFLGNGLWSHDS
jgi:DNA-binding transcriptional ArsR family regulator